MPKSPKKSPSNKPSPPRPNWVALIIAGAAGFFAAFVLLKGFPCSSMMSCPVLAPVCPVASTLEKLEGCLESGSLTTAKECGEKLTRLLEPDMPELAKSAEAIANAKTIAEARRAFAALEAKLESGSMPAPQTP